MNGQIYKPSNKGSIVGIILMPLSMLAVGLGLSWLYLVIKSAIPLIYLNVLLAAGVSLAIGGIGTLFVKLYKLRSPAMVTIFTVIALILVNYGKWAIYVAKDYDKYVYDEMKKITVSDIFGGAENMPNTKEEAQQVLLAVEMMKSYSLEDYFGGIEGMSTLMKVFGSNVGEIYESILGSTVDEILTNCQTLKSSNMSFYEYMYEHRENQVRDTMWLVSHPGELFSDIKDINEQGRWTITSHRYSFGDSLTDKKPVSGILLWLVWAGELAMLTIPAILLVRRKSKYPFIEAEDDWAVEDKPMPNFSFYDPYPGQSSGMGMVKSEILRNPNYLLNLQPVKVIDRVPEKFYKVTYCRSRYFDEIYITVVYSVLTNPRKNQRRTTNIVEFMRVDQDFMATLYGLFEYNVPTLCGGVNRAAEVKQEQEERAKAAASGRHLSPQRPKATGAEAIFDQPLYTRPQQQPQQPYAQPQYQQPTQPQQPYAQPQYQQPAQPQQPYGQPQYQQPQDTYSNAPRPTSGDMDGLDTSNLDLDHMDFK